MPTRTNYIFRGWSASRLYNNNRIAYNTGIYGGDPDNNNVSAKITQSTWTYATYCTYTGGTSSNTTLKLYAQWEQRVAATYEVSFDANGGNSDSVPASQTKTEGIDLILTSEEPTKAADETDYTITYH